MSDIRSVDSVGVVLQCVGRHSDSGTHADDGDVAVEDRVEISDLAHALSTVYLDADIRVDKVAEVRDALARGDYLTPQKLDIAIERAVMELDLE